MLDQVLLGQKLAGVMLFFQVPQKVRKIQLFDGNYCCRIDMLEESIDTGHLNGSSLIELNEMLIYLLFQVLNYSFSNV